MTKYRHRLPRIDGGLSLTDGGIETTMIHLDGLSLPHFAASSRYIGRILASRRKGA